MNMCTFSCFLLFFSCSLGRYLVPGYLLRGIDGDTYAFDDLQFIAAEDRSSKRFRTPISFIIIIIGHSLLLDRMTCRLLFRMTCSCTVSTTYLHLFISIKG